MRKLGALASLPANAAKVD